VGFLPLKEFLIHRITISEKAIYQKPLVVIESSSVRAMGSIIKLKSGMEQIAVWKIIKQMLRKVILFSRGLARGQNRDL
jgi:hypothetical protein